MISWDAVASTLDEAVLRWPAFVEVVKRLDKAKDHDEACEIFEVLNRVVSSFCDVSKFEDTASLTCALGRVEEMLNLGIVTHEYDVDFSFCLLIEKLDLVGVHTELIRFKEESWDLVVLDDGLSIVRSGDADHLPTVAPFESMLGLDLPISEQSLTSLLAIQSEVFRLVDVWETRNTVLAKKQNAARLARKGTHETDATYLELIDALNIRREHFARWVATGFVSVQKFCFELSKSDVSEDVKLSAEALEKLCLSGFQKLFLPAAVTRQKFGPELRNLFECWFQIRVDMQPQCLASALVLAACAPYKKAFRLKIFELLEKKNFEWRLGFDPLAALKSIAWTLPAKSYLELVVLFWLALGRKLGPDLPTQYWLSNVASAIEIRETFAPPLCEDESLLPADDRMTKLSAEAILILNKYPIDEETQSLVEFIKANVP